MDRVRSVPASDGTLGRGSVCFRGYIERFFGHVDTQGCHARLRDRGLRRWRQSRSRGGGCLRRPADDTVERETRELVNAKKIAWDVARDNGVAAAICVRQALE